MSLVSVTVKKLMIAAVIKKTVRGYLFVKNHMKVDGTNCGHCVVKVEKALKQLGVEVARVHLKKSTVKVKYDESKRTIENLNEAARDAGYESESTSKRWLI